MSDGAVRAARARLARAGRELRARPADEVIDCLARTLDAWSDPQGRWQRELVRDLSAREGFCEATVREGLSRALATWNADALHRLVAREIASPGRPEDHFGPEGFSETACVLAGAIPMPTLQNLLLPLVLRSPVLAKTGARDNGTAKRVVQSLRSVDPLLGRCVEIVDFRADDIEATRALLAAPCVVATGSDATLLALSKHVGPYQRFVGYGHRMSLAVVGPELPGPGGLDGWADRLALDTAVWDQSGCLSPAAVYCVGPRSFQEAVSRALAQALARAETRWPRGAVTPATAAAIRRARDEALMRQAASDDVEVLASAGTEWTVVREAATGWRETPLMRFLRVYPVSDPDPLLAALDSLWPWIATVALDGFGVHTLSVHRSLTDRDVPRVVSAGQMQTPEFDWHHDGSPLLLPLAQFPEP